MNNLEYYKDEIANMFLFADHCDWFVDKDNKFCLKENETCEDCKFSNNINCGKAKVEWLLAEHKEQPTITSNEKKFLEILDGRYKYIARDKDRELCAYELKPRKISTCWDNANDIWTSLYIRYLEHVYFDFIKWEDDEPWAVEDLLKLEVRDD